VFAAVIQTRCKNIVAIRELTSHRKRPPQLLKIYYVTSYNLKIIKYVTTN